MRTLIKAPILFSLIRISVGVYSFVFFYEVLASPSNLLDGRRLEFGTAFVAPFSVNLVCLLALVSAVLLTLGIARRVTAFVLWAGLVFVLSQNLLFREVHMDYWGWMLWLFIFAPQGESFSIWPPKKIDWQLPSEFYFAGLLCLGTSYTISGISKLMTEDWNNGEMLRAFFSLGFGSDRLTPWVTSQKYLLFNFLSIFVAVCEAVALPLILMPYTSLWIWLILTLGQLQMLIATRFEHIAIMLLFFHLLVFNPGWLPTKRSVK